MTSIGFAIVRKITVIFSITFVSVRMELMTDGYKRYLISAQSHSSCWIGNKILNG